MIKENMNRAGCKDVFRSWLVRDARFDGLLEMPILAPEHEVPSELLPFSQALASNKKSVWIHFYEDDSKFERIWNSPKRYIQMLERYEGVISPDFSVYRDMPLVMQFWNIYRSRAIAHALQSVGVRVIPNVRFGDKRTWDACCAGIPHHSVIAVGSHGNMKNSEDRNCFKEGLQYLARRLEPSVVVVYGSAPDDVFLPLKNDGVKVVSFASRFAMAHEGVI